MKPNIPRGCLPVITITNHEAIKTKNIAMPRTAAITIAGIAQMNRSPFVSRLAGSSYVNVVMAGTGPGSVPNAGYGS